ncbi:MAG: hypothetical protein K2X87_18085 [Gemmataceae bacterium]|nr:hypothetical protein [Gemmataceae bacterium]
MEEGWWFLVFVLVLVLLSGGGRPPRYREIDGRGRGWTTGREAQREHLGHFGWGGRKR